jgi:hypothetical protein
MYFVFIYENRGKKPDVIILKKGQRGMRENDGGG